MGAEEYGLIPELHPHAGGFMDFEPEVERFLAKWTEDVVKCVLIRDIAHMLALIPWPL